MATFTKLESGSWRVQVRRKRQYVANTFLRRHDAEEWALDAERSIDRGIAVKRSRPHEPAYLFRPHHPAYRRYDRSRKTHSAIKSRRVGSVKGLVGQSE